MSTVPPPTSAPAQPLAERGLFASLIDDAAVFPPGNAPVEVAIRRHLEHRGSGYAPLIGPLLLPAAGVGQAVEYAAGLGLLPPLAIVVVARPGTPKEAVTEALTSAHQTDRLRVVGLEVGWTPDWRSLDLGDLLLTLEVPRGAAQEEAVADIARDADDSVRVQAKFRTGATETWAWPDETELARFLRTSIDHELAFKLTGGLHHAVRGTHEGDILTGGDQHGLLNVLCAVRWALNGEEVPELAAILAERDPDTLVETVSRMTSSDAAIVRAFFTAYGCCEVTDPVRELAALDLIAIP